MATTYQTKDFVILGPALARGNGVIEAIHSLYFLPENYKLIFSDSMAADRSFYEEVLSLVERNELKDRVQFAGKARGSHVFIANATDRAARNAVTGDSPEALASAILDIARAAVV